MASLPTESAKCCLLGHDEPGSDSKGVRPIRRYGRGRGAGVLAAIVVLGSRTPLLLVAAPIGGDRTGVRGPTSRRRSGHDGGHRDNQRGWRTDATDSIAHLPASVLFGLLAIGLGLRDQLLRERLNKWIGICAGFVAVFLATRPLRRSIAPACRCQSVMYAVTGSTWSSG